ncbi:MAG: hypothetical protein DWI02_02795 [Planctomycetota bacterium]|nr:MAG: hypothetical protein DWI02_02795 [Planctomycetota bacterium]
MEGSVNFAIREKDENFKNSAISFIFANVFANVFAERSDDALEITITRPTDRPLPVEVSLPKQA